MYCTSTAGDPTTRRAAELLTGRDYVQCGSAGQRGDSFPWEDGKDGMRFHQSTWNKAQFKTCELFISVISHLILLDCD